MSHSIDLKMSACSRPLLSVVCIVYDMQREAARTLFTLSVAYQRNIAAEDYEVIVIDNGSPTPLEESYVTAFGANFRLLTLTDSDPSPVPAINIGLAASAGEFIAIMVDGARMLSPGVLFWTLEAMRFYPRVAVTVSSWHLGPDVQNASVQLGYNEVVEDDLLARVDWRSNGYLLFDCCERLDPSSEGAAWFDPVAESNFIACTRDVALRLGGFDVRFTSAGGGACNLDFFKRVVEDAGCPVVSLVGEGTFHQVHGGVSTNVARMDHPWIAMKAEYRAIRAQEWTTPKYDAILLGQVSAPAKHLLARSPNIFTSSPSQVSARWLRSAVSDLTLALSLIVKKMMKVRPSTQA